MMKLMDERLRNGGHRLEADAIVTANYTTLTHVLLGGAMKGWKDASYEVVHSVVKNYLIVICRKRTSLIGGRLTVDPSTHQLKVQTDPALYCERRDYYKQTLLQEQMDVSQINRDRKRAKRTRGTIPVVRRAA